MGKNVIMFFLSFAVAFGLGYVMFQGNGSGDAEVAQTKQEEPSVTEQPKAEAAPVASAEGEILVQKGCTACHAVSELGLQGGATGPDLSQAFVNVPDKHGVPLEEFLRKPTSAVMSSVLGSNPLTDEEHQALMEALQKASGK